MREGRPRVRTEFSILSVIASKDQRIENGFGRARLGRFVSTVLLVAVERRDLFPKSHALGDIIEE